MENQTPEIPEICNSKEFQISDSEKSKDVSVPEQSKKRIYKRTH